MSRRGNCWDYAVAESFFSRLKKERIRGKIYRTRSLASADIFDYVEMFYSRTRRHSHLSGVSPEAFGNASKLALSVPTKAGEVHSGKGVSMKTDAVALAVLFSIVVCGLLGPPAAMTEPSHCNLIEKRQVIFSDSTVKDTITAKISGKTCDEATESVKIQDPTGRVLYEFKSELRHAFRREITLADAQRVIQTLLDGFKPTSALGDWGTGFDVMEPEEMYPIDKSEYERIKAKNWVSYGHQVGWEGYVAVAYDRDRKRVVELIRGSN